MHDTFLGTGEFKSEVVMVEIVEISAHMLEDIAAVFAPMIAGITQDIELYIEEFLEFQTYLCSLKFVE